MYNTGHIICKNRELYCYKVRLKFEGFSNLKKQAENQPHLSV